MGIGFVIFIHLFTISVFSFICAVVGCVLIYFASKKERRRNKIIFVFIAPFVGFYTFYIVGIIGLSIVSESRKVDIGIGDVCYVPLKNDYQLIFIDIPEQAGISKNDGSELISGVEKIEEEKSCIFGKTYDNKYFLIDTQTAEMEVLSTEKELSVLHSKKKLMLMDATEFYSKRRDSIIGYWPLLIGFLSIVISAGAVYLWKLILVF